MIFILHRTTDVWQTLSGNTFKPQCLSVHIFYLHLQFPGKFKHRPLEWKQRAYLCRQDSEDETDFEMGCHGLFFHLLLPLRVYLYFFLVLLLFVIIPFPRVSNSPTYMPLSTTHACALEDEVRRIKEGLFARGARGHLVQLLQGVISIGASTLAAISEKKIH